MAEAEQKLSWEEGGGADEVPVLPHVFSDDPERCCSPLHADLDDGSCLVCLRCRKWVRPSQVNNRCPARAGQTRGYLQ